MQPFRINIKANGVQARAFQRLARKLGVTLQVKPDLPTHSLSEVLQEAEADFAEGRGTTFTLDELRALTHEVTT